MRLEGSDIMMAAGLKFSKYARKGIGILFDGRG